jgi:serine protease
MMNSIIGTFLRISVFALSIALVLHPEARAQQALTLNGKSYLQSTDGWYQLEQGKLYKVNDSIITVKPKKGFSPSDLEPLGRGQGARVLRTNNLGYEDLKVAVPGDVFKVVQNYLASGLVESAEVNTFGEFLVTPSDPFYSNQWSLNQANEADIDMPEAWNVETGNSTVVIGILDSGTDWTHEDLGYGTGSNNYSNIWLNVGEDA